MPVLSAIAAGDSAALTRALANGATPNATDPEGVPALIHAADSGDIALVRPLLEAGAPLERPDNIGWTALMAAVAAGSEELVGYLLTQNANANHVAREDTPLTIAVSDAPISIVTLLLNHGADANLRRPDGWTPLMLAAFRGDLERIRLLLEHGADPTVATGQRLTDAATVAAAHKHLEARDLLLTAAHNAAPQLRELWGGVQKWCETHAPDIAAQFENTVDCADAPEAWGALPAEVEEQLTGWASGLPFYDYQGLGLDEAILIWESMCERVSSGEFVGRSCTALGPDEPIHPVMWAEDWIPIAQDSNGNLLVIDLAPTEAGIRGQLLSWSAEQGPIAVLASGLTPYLRRLLAHVRSGRVRWDSATGGIFPTYDGNIG